MAPKPHELVADAFLIEGYKKNLAKDLGTTAALISGAEMGSPAHIFADEEIDAIRCGSVTALIVVAEILEHGREAVGCETLADVAERIARCAAAAYKTLIIDKE